MADNDPGILAEFEEFLNAKKEAESKASSEEDYDVEIWDEKGRGARVKRSHAKPFLQSLGLDADPEPSGNEGDNGGSNSGGNSPKSNRQSTGSQSNSTQAGGVARKYFTKPKAK